MIFINSKKILDCDENEEEKHNEEISRFLDNLYSLEDYLCGVIFKRIDIIEKDQEVIIKDSTLHQCMEMIEYVDCKNGVDLYEKDGFITFYVFGQAYCKNEKYNYVTHVIQIRPFDTNKNYVNVFRLLDSIEVG